MDEFECEDVQGKGNLDGTLEEKVPFGGEYVMV
jgi:hypothetical protein